MSSVDRAALLLWPALVVAFSPTAVELARHMLDEPWARYAIIPPLLLLRAAASDSKALAPRRAGLWLILGGLALELFGIVSGVVQVARLGLPPAIVGMSWVLGRPSLATAMLSLWIVPIPYLVIFKLSPLLEPVLLEPAAALAAPLVPGLAVDEQTLRWNSQLLGIAPAHRGLPLAALLSGIGWFDAARSGAGARTALKCATLWGLAAFPIQLVAIALAALMLRFGTAELGRAWLDHGVWILAAGVGILCSEWRLRSSRPGG